MRCMVPQPFAARGNRSYLEFWAIIDGPRYLGVLDPDSSPRSFRRAGGRSWSLNGRQNRYSYVTAGAITGYGGEAVGLKPPQS
jgi:hypothetical protein